MPAVTAHDRYFMPLFGAAVGCAWLALLLWEPRPTAAISTHDWTASGLAGSLCAGLPAGRGPGAGAAVRARLGRDDGRHDAADDPAAGGAVPSHDSHPQRRRCADPAAAGRLPRRLGRLRPRCPPAGPRAAGPGAPVGVAHLQRLADQRRHPAGGRAVPVLGPQAALPPGLPGAAAVPARPLAGSAATAGERPPGAGARDLLRRLLLGS